MCLEKPFKRCTVKRKLLPVVVCPASSCPPYPTLQTSSTTAPRPDLKPRACIPLFSSHLPRGLSTGPTLEHVSFRCHMKFLSYNNLASVFRHHLRSLDFATPPSSKEDVVGRDNLAGPSAPRRLSSPIYHATWLVLVPIRSHSSSCICCLPTHHVILLLCASFTIGPHFNVSLTCTSHRRPPQRQRRKRPARPTSTQIAHGGEARSTTSLSQLSHTQHHYHHTAT